MARPLRAAGSEARADARTPRKPAAATQGSGSSHACPVFEPTAAEWASTTLSEYVERVAAQAPGGLFRVRPPAGWAPSARPLPQEQLDALVIEHPIRQNAFGGHGAWRGVYVQEGSMTVKTFRELASREHNSAPAGKSDDELARDFWRCVEQRPPLYGADLQLSLFDEELATGWNLRNLRCLLQTSGLPAIPGVTTPMLYAGCWRALFAWHTEDADLHSINYLHAGAPKAWYCVAPAHRARFESLACSYFAELSRACPAFLRHKDIIISPTLLRQSGIPFTTAVQRAGEFVIVLAGAYHSGFNHGFNLAEAVNFATPSWVPIGRAARRCVCAADSVRIDMRLFSKGDVTDDETASDSDEGEALDGPAAGDVVAVVGQDGPRRRYMYLARVLGPGATRGCMRLQWLDLDADGLYREKDWGTPWEEDVDALVTAITYDVEGDAVRLRTPVTSLLAARILKPDGGGERKRRKTEPKAGGDEE